MNPISTHEHYQEIDADVAIADVNKYHFDDFESVPVLKAPAGNPHGRKKRKLVNLVCAFDIETSTLYDRDINFMYVWQFCIDGKMVVIGRRWCQLRKFFEKIISMLPDNTDLVVYVHNLSYEFQYLRGVFNFKPDDVFATERRRVVKCRALNRIEFRCSMMLSNSGLDYFTKSMNVKHQKLTEIGKTIYHKVIYPWDDLDSDTLKYAAYDTIGLCEAIKARMELSGDNLFTIPLTSTGFPRRDMKNAMRKYPHRIIREMMPTYEVYEMLDAAFMGGYTHANRFYARKILKPATTGGKKIRSRDRCSSYPDVLMNCMYPNGHWIRAAADAVTFRQLMKHRKAIIMTLELYDVTLKDPWFGAPYLSKDKTRNGLGIVNDNGRIVSMDQGTITITDVDFRIIHKIYNFRFRVKKIFYCDYEYLPEPFLNVVEMYYKKKTELKGVEGMEVEYALYKALLNSLYGMVAQRPVKQDIIFTGQEWTIGDEDPEKLLDAYQKRASLPYSVGVWCTAWARYRLFEGIFIVKNNFVYTDTDSVKYIDDPDTVKAWDAYNAERIADAKKSGAYAYDRFGNIHYMGVYEEDGLYNSFVTYGSKRYAYTDEKDELHITVSGVNKKSGAKELGSIENFKEGFVFTDSGKTESDYCDAPVSDQLVVDGKDIEITPYIVIRDTTYTLSMSDEYVDLLNRVSDFGHNVNTLR